MAKQMEVDATIRDSNEALSSSGCKSARQLLLSVDRTEGADIDSREGGTWRALPYCVLLPFPCTSYSNI
jgi:hypothetical protein